MKCFYFKENKNPWEMKRLKSQVKRFLCVSEQMELDESTSWKCRSLI